MATVKYRLFTAGNQVCVMNKTKKLVMTALLTALTCVATMVIRVPTPTGGYVNLGDAVVLLSAFLLGPVLGAVAGGVGAAMADFLSGCMAWVPATLIIKGCMGLVAGLLYQKLGKKGVGVFLSGLPAELIMVVGYFGFEAALLGQGMGAAVGIPGNLIQAGFGLAAGTLLTLALRGKGGAGSPFRTPTTSDGGHR